MRVVLLLALVAFAVSPAAHAETGGGRGYGVDLVVVTAGGWDLWYAYVGAPTTLDAVLTWGASALGADYDLTLWRAGAADDGHLGQDEILNASWTRGTSPRTEHVNASVAAHERPYAITVEPVSARGEPYALDLEGAGLTRVCSPVSLVVGGCVPAALGVKVG